MTAVPQPMKTRVVKKLKLARPTDETRVQNGENYWRDALRLSEPRYRRLFETAQETASHNRNPMELTITQNGALYALHHGASENIRSVRKIRAEADWIRVLPTLATPREKFTMRPIPAEKDQFTPQENGAQVADVFPEYRAAA
jgi:hypothetical protein